MTDETSRSRILCVDDDPICLEVLGSILEREGYEVCERLAAENLCPDVPVVFQTARRDVEDKAQLLSAGAVDYVLKPFEREVLVAKVKLHLESKNRWTRLGKWRELSRARVDRSEFPRFKDFLQE